MFFRALTKQVRSWTDIFPMRQRTYISSFLVIETTSILINAVCKQFLIDEHT